MAFYQCRNVAVLSADQQITFPMTGNRAIFRFRGSFADGDSVDDLTARLSAGAGMARVAHAPFRPQVVHQLFFQHSPRLNEQAAIDGLVAHAHSRHRDTGSSTIRKSVWATSPGAVYPQ